MSNINNWLKCWKKANISKKLGYRSSVRGIAMNPVDHPHGGGQMGVVHLLVLKVLLQKGKKHEKKKYQKI